MVSGIGMALAGALEGWSDAKLDELKEERKRRLEELKEAAADRRAREERDFQKSEKEKDRLTTKEEGRLSREQRLKELSATQEFQSGENTKTREFQSGERKAGQEFESGERGKDREFQSDERMLDRDFQSTEKDEDRAYQTEEKDKERKYQSEEKEKDRSETADIVTGQDGKSYVRRGTKLYRVTDEEGNPVNLATTATGKDKPAEVSTAEWLIQQGVAKDAREAWSLVRSARQDPEKSRATIYRAWMEALTKGQFGKVDGAEVEKQARDLTEKTVRYLETDGAEGTAPPDGGEAPKSEEAAPQKSGKASRPPGSGSVDDPYVASTQEQIDWFRKYAKPGDRITVDDGSGNPATYEK